MSYPVRIACRSAGASPARFNILTARASAASMTIPSPGSRPHRNVTTQSAHASVCCIVHSSQLIVIGVDPMLRSMRTPPDSQRPLRDLGVAEGPLIDRLNRSPVTTPPARDRLDRLGQHLTLGDLELTADRVVVKRPLAAGDGHVEPGEVAARGTPVAGRSLSRVHGFGAYRPGGPGFTRPPNVRSIPCPGMSAVARSFDDLGTPLCDVTFVVLDLETTGGSPANCEITEIGAVKIQGGKVLGTFHTLVNPGSPIPASIVFLTGITEAMVYPAPRVESVIESFVRFVGGAVIVGHNVRFDLGFLAAAMDRNGYPRFGNTVVDTCALARRLVRDEVPNCKLHTLAAHFRSPHRPTHRALDDALATCDVLHALLERAGSLGVLGLEDLVALPTVGGHPQLGKLTLTKNLPRAPGVYVFRDRGGRPLYVGKAVDLRRRVRSYFTGDDRRKIGGLLRELVTIDHVECSSELEACVLEVRMIHQLTPRYNTRTKHWRSYTYVKLTLDEAFPRLSVVRQPRRGDGCFYLGPVGSTRAARLITEAIETAVPLRRCRARLGVGARSSALGRDGPCAAAQLGVASCPCAGAVGAEEYATFVRRVVRGLTVDADLLLRPLADRLVKLSDQRRYEEAADLRDRTAALARAIERQRRHDAIRRAGRLHIDVAGESWAVVERGILRSAGRAGAAQLDLWDDTVEDAGTPGAPLPRHLVDEVATIVAWLDARAARVRVVDCDAGLAWPSTHVPTSEARAPRPTTTIDGDRGRLSSKSNIKRPLSRAQQRRPGE